MILHIFWAWLFIAKFELGPMGAGITKNIFELCNMVIILLYVTQSDQCRNSWVPFAEIDWKEVIEWEGIKKFLSFTIPIAAILFLDMACYEVFSILANSASLYYSLPLGLSIAIMTYVSHAMGAGKINAAKNYTYYGMIVDVVITSAFVSFIWVFKNQWADLFSANAQTKQLLLSVLYIYLLLVFFDGLQVGLSGTLKGIGKQNAATVAMIISYYFVALPLIYYLAFELNMQVTGIWIGFSLGIIALLVVYLFILKNTNLAVQAKMLSRHLGEEIEMVSKL